MGTALVGIILLAIVTAISVSLIRNKQKGKTSCGQNCAHCAISGTCHSQKKKAHEASLGHTTVLTIDGMMCPMCESHINDAIRNNFSVKSVKSSHKTGLVQIVSEEEIDEEKIRSVIKDTGYTLNTFSRI